MRTPTELEGGGVEQLHFLIAEKMLLREPRTTASTRARRGDVLWLEPDESRDFVAHPHVVIQDDIFSAG